MDALFSPIVIGALGVILLVVLVAMLFSKNYVKVPPNMVAVFTGRGRQVIVRGGARLRMPIVERVDFMPLEPYPIDAHVNGVIAMDGVPVNVTAAAQIKIGSTDEAIGTAVERFLTIDRSELHRQISEILNGNLRSIVSQMTVEELNGNREELTRKVIEEAQSSFGPIGMQLDVLVIQSITDDNGYLDALGRRRIAEVMRDAEIGEANARRDAAIQSASADREGKTAQAKALAEIAEAERDRDVRVQAARAQVLDAEARTAQAGPLAEAEARRAVVLAETAVEREAEQARIGVEEQRVMRAEKAAQADVIVPAEAAAQAAVVNANAQRDAAIAEAEAAAKTRELESSADAEARRVLAAAEQIEMEARAAGEAAGLKAQAEGQRELVEALRLYDQAALHASILPELIRALPELAQHFAAPLGSIDRMTVIDGGGSAGDGQGDLMSRVLSTVPVGIAGVIESIRATTGYDLTEFIKNPAAASALLQGNGNGASSSASAAEESITGTSEPTITP